MDPAVLIGSIAIGIPIGSAVGYVLYRVWEYVSSSNRAITLRRERLIRKIKKRNR